MGSAANDPTADETREPLDAATTALLLQAVDACAYKEMWALLASRDVVTAAQQELRGQVLDAFATKRLPEYRSKWDRNVGVVLSSLGLAQPGTGSDEFWQQRGWGYQHPDGIDGVALADAKDLMRERADTWRAFGASSAGEVLGIAQREVRTQLLCGALADPTTSLALWGTIVVKGLPATAEAVATRKHVFESLIRRAGGCAHLAVLVDYKLVYELWRPCSQALGRGETSYPAADVLFRLLAAKLDIAYPSPPS